MADQLEVSNPFTRYENRMRRNTRNSRWVDTNDLRSVPRQRAGPRRKVQHITQPHVHASHVPSRPTQVDDYEHKCSPDKCVSPKSGLPSQPPHVDDISPLSNPNNTRHGSFVSSLYTADYAHPEEATKGSDATVLPYFPTDFEKPGQKPKNQRHKSKNLQIDGDKNKPLPAKPVSASHKVGSQKSAWWRTAKDIYETGPQGEGQKVWRAYQRARKENLGHAEMSQNVPDFSRSRTSASRQQRAEPGHTVHAALRPLPSQIPLNQRYIKDDVARKESEISHTSYEVPLSIDSSIHRNCDISKPLPPVPQLDPAPKTRRKKALPVPPKQKSGHAYHSSSSPDDPNPPLPAKDPWWRALSDKQTAKAHVALKAKISRPAPLLAPNSSATNVAALVRGVGSPAAASSQPSDRIHAQDFAYTKSSPLHPSQIRDCGDITTKGKGRAREETPSTHWLDRFTPASAALNKSFLHRPHNRRHNSDESFACQGLPPPDPDFGRQGLGIADVDAFKHAQLYLDPKFRVTGKGKERLVPEPLFHGPWVKIEAAKEGVLREY
ncbi:hypothetical protein J1614_011731 [Plenodomus biglobosus]|nr:hypothetical protein J1614_011731 [Plenodomus biglobosus]